MFLKSDVSSFYYKQYGQLNVQFISKLIVFTKYFLLHAKQALFVFPSCFLSLPLPCASPVVSPGANKVIGLRLCSLAVQLIGCIVLKVANRHAKPAIKEACWKSSLAHPLIITTVLCMRKYTRHRST